MIFYGLAHPKITLTFKIPKDMTFKHKPRNKHQDNQGVFIIPSSPLIVQNLSLSRGLVKILAS